MSEQQEDASFWISYSDLAVGVLMVFVLITTVLLLDTLENSHEAEREKQIALEASKEAQDLEKEAKKLKEELQSKTSDIEALVGVRQSLIQELSRQFAKQGQQVKIDPKTGALQLPSNIIFTQGQSRLSPTGRRWLKEFVPQYLGVLLSERFAKYVTRIEVEGHASSEGAEFANLELSQARALAVTTYILKNHTDSLSPARRKQLRQILAATGRGEYELVFNEQNKEDRNASRRVVFKFRLTEEQTLKQIEQLLKKGE